MKSIPAHRVKTITAYHRFMGLTPPENPLISLIRFEDIRRLPGNTPVNLVMELYSIALKRNFNARMKYGQQAYDFDEGLMTFVAPGQVIRIEVANGADLEHSGWLLLIHPDFLWNTALAKKIRQYEYFGYAVNEALYLSEKEEATMTAILQDIRQEYSANTDAFSQDLIIARIALLLIYADRFYHRQFITRRPANHKLLDRLENLLAACFNTGEAASKGLPTVQYIAGTLNVSPNYLSTLLKVLTGQSTRQHIHDKLIEKAKEKLSSTDLSVSEIAYELGFEHPQSFSKLFKSKTAVSPLEFRQGFN